VCCNLGFWVLVLTASGTGADWVGCSDNINISLKLKSNLFLTNLPKTLEVLYWLEFTVNLFSLGNILLSHGHFFVLSKLLPLLVILNGSIIVLLISQFMMELAFSKVETAHRVRNFGILSQRLSVLDCSSWENCSCDLMS